MPKVIVHLADRSYPIVIRRGVVHQIGMYLPQRLQSPCATIITNRTVAPLYVRHVSASLADIFPKINIISIPDGERYKTITQLQKIYHQLAAYNLERTTPIIALGGGVVGDIAGFAAATFLRGVPLVQIPTTLLAQVDSSVGGKTGVNLAAGKNLVGAFYQPSLVAIDPEVLSTLPQREFAAGMAEVIKYAILKGGELFQLLVNNMQKVLAHHLTTLEQMITLCCTMKADIVSRDEREQGIRAYLNYGHTIGHAVETLTGYKKYKHGEAVAIGMLAETRIAVSLGMCSEKTFAQLQYLLQQAGLPTALPDIPAHRYLAVMEKDKKKAHKMIRMVLPEKIGKVVVVPLSSAQVSAILRRDFKLMK